jgi:YspA, cpYpsA-related SLOG family
VRHQSEQFTLVHGACPTGTDHWADEWGRNTVGVTVERHPADWKMGRQAGHWRNQHMINLGADVVVAFRWPGAANRGTDDCIRRAREAGLDMLIVNPRFERTDG